MSTSTVQQIKSVATDLMTDFLYYDRKEDYELPRGEIEREIKLGNITVEEILAIFEKELRSSIG